MRKTQLFQTDTQIYLKIQRQKHYSAPSTHFSTTHQVLFFFKNSVFKEYPTFSTLIFQKSHFFQASFSRILNFTTPQQKNMNPSLLNARSLQICSNYCFAPTFKLNARLKIHLQCKNKNFFSNRLKKYFSDETRIIATMRKDKPEITQQFDVPKFLASTSLKPISSFFNSTDENRPCFLNVFNALFQSNFTLHQLSFFLQKFNLHESPYNITTLPFSTFATVLAFFQTRLFQLPSNKISKANTFVCIENDHIFFLQKKGSYFRTQYRQPTDMWLTKAHLKELNESGLLFAAEHVTTERFPNHQSNDLPSCNISAPSPARLPIKRKRKDAKSNATRKKQYDKSRYQQKKQAEFQAAPTKHSKRFALTQKHFDDWEDSDFPDYANFGGRTESCKFCKALLYNPELQSDGSGGTLCCNRGKIKFHPSNPPPTLIKKLLTETSPEAKVTPSTTRHSFKIL